MEKKQKRNFILGCLVCLIISVGFIVYGFNVVNELEEKMNTSINY